MSEATAHATVRAVWLAARAAVGLLRARWFAVLIAMVCVQGAVVWSMPLLVALLRWTLRRMSITGVNLDTLDTVVTSPLAVIVLVILTLVATFLVFIEAVLFAVMAHLALEGKRITFIHILRSSRAVVRKMFGWQGLLLVPYLAVLLPISELGFSSRLTQHIALPKFISGELLKTAPGTLLYVVVMGAVVYVMLRLLLFPAIVSDSDATIVGALSRSLRMTSWRALLGFGTVMLVTSLIAWLVLVLLGGVGLVPVITSKTHTTAGVVLGLLEVAQFLVAGAAAAFLAFFFVAYVRAINDRPLNILPAQQTGWSTRVGSAVVVVLAILGGVPQVVTATEAASLAAQTAPQVIGHRGYPARAVENSVSGLRAAVAAGTDMVETDIQETRDGGLVVMHDVGLGRLTGEHRNVYELTEAEATELTIRQNGYTAPVPTFDEFVREADERGVPLLVEVKPHGHEQPGFARRLVSELDRLDPDHTHTIQSLDRELIEDITLLDPDRSTAFVVSFHIGDLPATRADAVVLEDWSIHDRLLLQAHKQGRDIYTWTINEVGSLRQHIARGVDGIITDDIDRAVAIRDRLSADPVTFYLERSRKLVTVP